MAGFVSGRDGGGQATPERMQLCSRRCSPNTFPFCNAQVGKRKRMKGVAAGAAAGSLAVGY
jgi:hypothetical protein